MSKPSSSKKNRAMSTSEAPFTQRTAYFNQKLIIEQSFKTAKSKDSLNKITNQNQNHCNNKYFNFLENHSNLIKLSTMQSKQLSQRQSTKKQRKVGSLIDVDLCLKELKNRGFISKDMRFDLETIIEGIVQEKIGHLLEICVEKYCLKYMSKERQIVSARIKEGEKQIKRKISEIEKGYDQMIQTYDHFLQIVEVIKDKPKTMQKYVKKSQFQTIISKTESEMQEIINKLSSITSHLDAKHQTETIKKPQIQQIYPNDKEQFTLDSLKVVVRTYNQNFIHIDQKFKQLYSHIYDF